MSDASESTTVLPVDDVVVQTHCEVTQVSSPDFKTSKAMLLQLISDAVQKKPTTKEDAIALFHSIQVAMGPWLVSALPPLEQKAVLVGLWAVEQLQAVDYKSCLAFLK